MAAKNENIAVIAGCKGMNGSHATQKLLANGWKVIGICRRKPEGGWAQNPNFQHLSADVLKEEDCKKISESQDVAKASVFIYAAFIKKDDREIEYNTNAKMYKNCLNAVEKGAKNLKRVLLVTGTKYYGEDLNVKLKTPFREDDPRKEYLNFYYPQEDYTAERQKESKNKWTFAILRPHDVLGFSNTGGAMNYATTLAAYAVLCKERGEKLRWPGNSESLHGAFDCTSADLFAEAVLYLTDETNVKTQNEAFNVVNADIIRWEWLWPEIARYFGIQYDLKVEPFPLAEKMKNCEKEWADIAQKHNLKEKNIKDIATWGFLDWGLNRKFDYFADSNKLYEAGFTKRRRTEAVYLSLFEVMKSLGAIPKYEVANLPKFGYKEKVEPLIAKMAETQIAETKMVTSK